MKLYLTITPPGPVTDRIDLDIRWAVAGEREGSAVAALAVDGAPVGEPRPVALAPGRVAGGGCRVPARGMAGRRTVTLTATEPGGPARSVARAVEILPSAVRSPLRLGGAWVGLLHWSEAEGAYWNPELARFTEADWREHVRGMHAIGLDTVIVQETWRNQTYYGIHYHQMTAANYRATYAGRAFYPSSLWPGRMDLPCADPLAAILDEADGLGMHVFLGLGNYAHFDYTPGSLAWHLDVLRELWSLYGQHPSLVGWYVSEELNGRIKPHEMRYWDRTDEFRAEVLAFFKTLQAEVRRLAPHTLLMMAPDSHYHAEAAGVWPELVRHCDIVCVQGYQRRPIDGVPAAEAARRMQGWCDAAGAHHWVDLEIFGFEHPGVAEPQRESVSRTLPNGTQDFVQTPLIPQRMALIGRELGELADLEFVCAYQYPGLLCPPGARLKPGGERAVRLYREYESYLRRLPRGGAPAPSHGGPQP